MANDLDAPVNVLILSPEDGGTPEDPLNVIPDDYEEDFGIEDYEQAKHWADIKHQYIHH